MNINIITTAEYIGAIITIVTFFISIKKYIDKLIKTIEGTVENTVNDTLNDVKKDLDENTMYVLKLIIINDRIPVDERVECGRRYLEKGGDGAIHELVDELEKKLLKKYKGEKDDK